MADYEKSV